METEKLFYAVNNAIWLRDNAFRLSQEMLCKHVGELSDYGVFSSRQIFKIAGGKLSHVKINKINKKDTKSGGRLNPKSLDFILQAMLSKSRGHVDFVAVEEALATGTSQNMVSRLTGISQSVISRKLNGN